MAVYLLDSAVWFPPVHEAAPDGLLAAGGDLSVERLLLAYRSGIFPWFGEGEIPLWWAPDPRFVLFPDELRISKSMQQVINKRKFELRINDAFHEVITNCRNVKRKGMDGTWITEDMVAAYTELYHMGYAYSAEAWQNGKLVGGLYGVKMNGIFFGESMFSLVSNASKFAFICWVSMLRETGTHLIDCQVHTRHLASLGARMVPRKRFMKMVGELQR